MTGDDTEKVSGHAADADVPAPAAARSGGADVAPVELTPAEQTVPDFDVPEPPSFTEADGDLPVPDAVTAEPVIPPPPVFEDERDAAASASGDVERPATRRAAQRARSLEPTVPQVSYVDVAPEVSSDTADGGGYRGWTVAIYAGLAVLFLGAIGFMAFLGLRG